MNAHAKVESEGIEPPAATALINGKSFTDSRAEHLPKNRPSIIRVIEAVLD